VSTFELRVLPRIAEIPSETWDALVDEEASPFVEHAWLASLEDAECVGPSSGWLPRHLALYQDGEVVAAAPAYLKTNSEGEFVFDWSWADLAHRLGLDYYPKLVLAVPFTPATGARVLCQKGRDLGETVEIFAHAIRKLTGELGLSGAHVLFPREREARAWEEAGFSSRLGVQYHWQNHNFATYEDFLATLPQKKRTQMRRERRQPRSDGVVIRTLEEHELSPEVVRTMYALYTTTVDKYFYGRRYLTQRFFELVTQRFRARLAWVVAEKDGEILASAFNVKKNDTLYGRYWGTFVEQPFLHFNVCYYHGIEQAIREGLRTFNPGAGGEHKRVRGFLPTVTHSAHHLEDPRLRGIIDAFLERERRAVREHVAESGEP
jgi:uncharacterized protein